jgi:hypothetical protein
VRASRKAGVGVALISGVLFVLVGCAPLIADYSPQAYQYGTSLKVDVAAMVAKSTDDYTTHAAEVDALTLKMNEASEFVKDEPTNTLSARQWQIMLDPNQGLYGGFVNLWKTKGRLSADEAGDKGKLISRGFDYIICLEANKQKPDKCAT